MTTPTPTEINDTLRGIASAAPGSAPTLEARAQCADLAVRLPDGPVANVLAEAARSDHWPAGLITEAALRAEAAS